MPRNGETTLMTSWQEKTLPRDGSGVTVTRFNPGGDPHVTALVRAVFGNYNRWTDRPEPTEDMLRELTGRQVTLLQSGQNMLGGELLIAREGRVMIATDGAPALLPKGASRKGFRVKPDELLDVEPLYSTAKIAARVEQVKARLPKLSELTLDDLKTLPTNGSTCRLAVFGSYPLPDGPAVDALWLCYEYWPTDDILSGVLFVRPENGFSENGSVYGHNQLLRFKVGKVEGFEPISLKEALELTDADHDEVLARIASGKTEALCSP